MTTTNVFVAPKELREEVRLYRIPQVMDLLGLGRTAVYELLRSGRLRSVRDYIRLLEREAREAGQ